MKLKHQYAFSLLGFVLLSFSIGWIGFSTVSGYPQISIMNAFGFIIGGLGFAITIKMLSTIRKIDIVIEDLD